MQFLNKRLISKIRLIAILFFGLFFFKSQTLNYINYTDLNGLPSNEVFGIAIDKKGYLWVCTDKGVSKFDGSIFTNLTSLNGLLDNVIFHVTHDYMDRIWLWSYNQQYNFIQKSKIYNYKYNNILNAVINKNYSGAIVGVGRNEKMFFYINGDNISIDNKGKITRNDKIIFGGDYIITFKGYEMVNEGIKNFPIEKIKNENWFREKMNNPISLYVDQDNYYFINRNEIFFLNKKEKKIIHFNDSIESLCVDNKKRIWISFSLTAKLKLYKNFNSIPKTLLENSAGKLLKDKQGNIWYSNSFKGLFKFPNSFIESYALEDANVLSVLLPFKNAIRLSSYNVGVYRYDNISGKIHNYPKNYVEKESINTLKAINYNLNKIEFYGTYDPLLIIGKDTISRIKTIQKEENKYILGCHNYFYTVNIDSKHNNIKKYPVKPGKLKDLYYLDDQNIFFATINGMYISNIENENYRLLDDKIFSHEHTQVIKRIGDYLLFGTKGKGLAVYSLKKRKITAYYNQSNSEMPNSISAIFVENNNLWIGSNLGIYIYNFSHGLLSFRNKLNNNDGLSSNDILSIFIKNNKLYCITRNEFNIIDLNNPDIFKTPIPNIPEIVSIKIQDHISSNLNSVVTDYNKNNIEVIFNSAYLLDKTRISYYYRLINSNTRWQSTNGTRINLTNLPPGKYVLEFYSTLDRGRLKSKMKTLHITVSQPYWMSSIFKITMFILLLILMFGIVSYYFYRKSVESERRRQITEYQQQALRAQMKPHFIFNALGSIQNFVLKNKINNALDFIEKISTLTRSVLDSSEKEYIPLSKELSTVRHYLDIEKIRFRNFDYQINLAESINPDLILVPSLILQPIVENAIWHGLQEKKQNDLGLITLSVIYEEHFLYLITEDNGVGRAATERISSHKSKGLSLLKKRLSLLEIKTVSFEFVDLYNQEGKACGTRVILKLPLKNQNNDN